MKVVLVVDDEYALVEALEALLTDEGYLVVGAHDGAVGLERFVEHRPAVVLVDLMMPVMDGVDMVRAVRARADAPRPFVVMMSAAPPARIPDDVRPDAFLRKPFDFPALAAVLREAFSRG